jgi:hypothetical protein
MPLADVLVELPHTRPADKIYAAFEETLRRQLVMLSDFIRAIGAKIRGADSPAIIQEGSRNESWQATARIVADSTKRNKMMVAAREVRLARISGHADARVIRPALTRAESKAAKHVEKLGFSASSKKTSFNERYHYRRPAPVSSSLALSNARRHSSFFWWPTPPYPVVRTTETERIGGLQIASVSCFNPDAARKCRTIVFGKRPASQHRSGAGLHPKSFAPATEGRAVATEGRVKCRTANGHSPINRKTELHRQVGNPTSH